MISKTIVLYGYKERVPVRMRKFILVYSSITAKLRQAAGMFTESAALGSVSPLTPLRALLRTSSLWKLLNKLTTTLLMNLNMFVVVEKRS